MAALVFGSGCLFTFTALADRVIVIGDSWAEPIGERLRNVAVGSGRPDIEISTTPYWGGPRNLDTPEGRAAINGWLNQWPNATHIYMQMGQNNWLCCWDASMIGSAEETELFESIIGHMDNVVEHILSIRPGITMLWTAGEYFRPHHLGNPAQLNANHDRLADMAASLARARPELYFIHWNGLFQVTYGFDGVQHSIYDPNYVIPPGDPALPDPSLPSPYAAYPENRPAHPRPGGYNLMAQEIFRVLTSPLPQEEIFDINPGLNGNWWNGAARSGEGVQVEVAQGGAGALVFVATIYSYDPGGNQIFLVAVGPVSGDTANVDVFITAGGHWGEGFDPALVSETQWGTGRFIALGCDEIQMVLTPNAEHQGVGYSLLEYGLVRLTTPALPCPSGTPD